LSFCHKKVKFGQHHTFCNQDITGIFFHIFIDCPIRSSEPGDETRVRNSASAPMPLSLCKEPPPQAIPTKMGRMGITSLAATL
jgi:hypothetical protein